MGGHRQRLDGVAAVAPPISQPPGVGGGRQDPNLRGVKDGLRYRFFRRMQNGEVTEAKCVARRVSTSWRSGHATYTLPEQKVIELPAGTLFPTAHSLKLIERAEAGETLVLAVVFDGSDDKGPMEISAALAGSSKPAAEQAKLSPLLAAGPVYRLSLAFYAPQGEATTGDEATPQQEQSVENLLLNGVYDRLTLDDLGNFTGLRSSKRAAVPAPGRDKASGYRGSGYRHRGSRQARGLCGSHPRPVWREAHP